MKIIVLNGSPKGKLSISLMYLKYIETQFPENSYKIFNIGQRIKKIEKSPDVFSEIMEEIGSADGIFWVTPVYTMMVPSQLMRFVELVFERDAKKYFHGKYATAITTSEHFYDNVAHNYLHGVSEELMLKYQPGYSAEMDNLLNEKNRQQFIRFADHFFKSIKENRPMEIKYDPVKREVTEYKTGEVKNVPKTGSKSITLVTDATDTDVNLNRMIDVFIKAAPHPVELININDLTIKGGCLGCLRCAYDNVCVYNDDVKPVYQDKLMKTDAIVFAGTIGHQFLSARWKMFLDRFFFNGHCPKLQGKKAAFLISGPLRQLPNLRYMLESRMEIWKLFCAGFVTDELNNSEDITANINRLAEDISWAVENNIEKPATFLGVGGRKVFRDLIYKLKFIFISDHKFYKKNKHYDFPQKEIKFKVLNGILRPMMKVPSIRKKIQKNINKIMVKPFERYIG